ncbi:2-polyprenyl-6-methoxyphenol hydroxylase-like FAD-dependent oxidoreductase [Nocardia tenerifensis]|uniref:2-polyprenyl-6-methoxyphenol hydroxylase-like FAD-dependent oxidoreductase n=1 Tax=Nocardia tenerifensis TaxID=228006 RepID=A0A318KTY3_9NOCA|nr:FAD-dependent monooxygenase [Nocardia tenerifensis]PXX66967.1 2-polyprenyl-6-methoxyphenol hydroxylase-like FAD-dependent oxidoreductase [Nocardia tenerifensis]
MNTTPLPDTTSVAIVGAGPAGLTAAITLADAGVDFVLLDRLAEGANTSRAAVVHARTLEVLEELGIAEELVSKGLVVPRFTLHDGARTLATVRFDGLPTQFPYTLMVPQDTTEEVLLARLRKAGGDVHRPYQVTRVVDENGCATIEYTDASGAAGSLRADYVIGADGMHSVVREQAGIGFTGDTYPASFVLADVRMTWPIPRDEVALHLSPEGVTVVAPLPDAAEPNRYRVVATVDEAPEHPTRDDIQAILDTRGPGGGIEVAEVLWSSRFRVHHRVADHYRAGRLFLAGDAAHVHSPAGGQGMNTGIQDAATLGPLLARVLTGEPPALLDTYETTRRPIALDVVTFTDRMTRMATLTPRPARALRNLALTTATRIPRIRTALAYRLSELANR